MTDYQPLSNKVNDLKTRGFAIDFNLGFNGIQSRKASIALTADQFNIIEVYRFEGDRHSDPEDQAIIYVIESVEGHKGILVNSFGTSSDPVNEAMYKKLSIRS